MVLNPRWLVIGQYSNVQLKPLPLPPKKLPHKLGFIPKYLTQQTLPLSRPLPNTDTAK